MINIDEIEPCCTASSVNRPMIFVQDGQSIRYSPWCRAVFSPVASAFVPEQEIPGWSYGR